MATKFGYIVEAPVQWPELLALARELDEHSRFDSFWIADSLVPNGPLDEPRLESYTALAAIAQATSRMRLGVHVTANALRHPAVLAKIITTLDHISGGRIELGIGAGWPGENRRFGIEFWKRPERMERLDEAMEVIKRLWTQPKPKYQGKHYRLDEPPYNPPNVQQPRPRILIGGGSDPMLRAIAKHADKASPMIDGQEARRKVEAYCGEIGRNYSDIGWYGGGQLFLNDDDGMQQRAIAYAKEQYGSSEEDTRRGLFGSVEEVRASVRRQIAEGTDELVMFQLPKVHVKSLMRFSDEVIPEFA